MNPEDSRSSNDSSDEATDPLRAARELQAWCGTQGWRFCFIGGLAVQRWGNPRFTKDADMTLLTEIHNDAEFCDALLARYAPRYPNMREFALRSRVLLLVGDGGVPIDIALGALDFERRSVARATPWTIEWGATLLTCSAEDLVVHKAFASRPLDWSDVEGIVARQGRKLNQAQIFSELEQLQEFKETVDLLSPLHRIIREVLG